ncbi:MAG TPA: hypothetical protein VII48_10205, partial [Rhizomicrobium sp.]
ERTRILPERINAPFHVLGGKSLVEHWAGFPAFSGSGQETGARDFSCRAGARSDVGMTPMSNERRRLS